MIEIKCNKRQYERIISSLAVSSERNKGGLCVLGRSYRTCPTPDLVSITICDACIRKEIKRIEE